MEDRKKILELFSKQLAEGLPFAGDFIDADNDIENNSLLARNLSEDALAQQVMKNTGIPIPDKTASKSKMEDFYHRIMKERYPELTPKIMTGDLKSEGAAGWYNPVFDTIALDENLHKERGLERAVGTLLHESGHQYDDKMKIKNPNSDLPHISKELDMGVLRKARDSGFDLKNADPAQVYEMYSKGHHAEIPKLREGSFGLGALKSMLKSGTFKATGSPLGLVSALFEDINRPEELPKANPVAQAKIAKAYEEMKHNPNDPAVKKAYDALSNETSRQFEELQKKGLKTTKIGDKFPNPYKSSADLIKDVRENNHMAYYPTDAGYGSGGADAAQDHPLLKMSKHLDADGKPMPINDLFRVVHDYQGHVEGGNKFGATGEERAFQQHSKMFSPEAQKALASETRGQNSWVNFGPAGEANRANPAATTYAEQKAGLLPDWATKDLQDIENPTLGKIHKASKLAARVMPGLGITAAIAPVAADLKEGKPNTAMARVVSYGAPFGSEEITDKLMADANLQDTAPELTDPSYLRTLKNIGARRMNEGKSPIVESFSGQNVDTSATELSDIENRIKALQRLRTNG